MNIHGVGQILFNMISTKQSVSELGEYTDQFLPQVNFSSIENAIDVAKNCAIKVNSALDELIELVEDTEVTDFHLGDQYDLKTGTQYYEVGDGSGNSGVIGENPWRDAGTYVVDRIAYYINGKTYNYSAEEFKEKFGDISVEEARKKIAKEEGVNVEDIDSSLHIMTEDGRDTGWLGKDADMSNISNVSSDKSFGDELDEALSKIESEFSEREKNYTKVTEQKSNDFLKTASESAEKANKQNESPTAKDFFVTAGNQLADVVVGALNVATLGNTSRLGLGKAVDDKFEEWGSYSTDKDKMAAKVVGGAALIVGASVATAGIATGAAVEVAAGEVTTELAVAGGETALATGEVAATTELAVAGGETALATGEAAATTELAVAGGEAAATGEAAAATADVTLGADEFLVEVLSKDGEVLTTTVGRTIEAGATADAVATTELAVAGAETAAATGEAATATSVGLGTRATIVGGTAAAIGGTAIASSTSSGNESATTLSEDYSQSINEGSTLGD